MGSVMAMARRCDPLKIRIKCFCKKESITQAQYSDLINVSKTTVSRFMSGESGVQSECYTRSMVYLKKKMPLSQCNTEGVKIKPTMASYEWVSNPLKGVE